MSDEIMNLADGFEPATEEAWRAEAERVLRGRGLDALTTTTVDGLSIKPLYVREDLSESPAPPGLGDQRRGRTALGNIAGWDVRQRHLVTAGTESTTNAAILEDLERGVTSVELDMHADQLNWVELLDGVMVDLVAISLRSAGDGTDPGRELLTFLAGMPGSAADKRADLGCDPIGSFGRGALGGADPEEAIGAAAALAATCLDQPGVRALRVDGTSVAEAGGSPATEIAVIAASTVAYLRALAGLGVGPGEGLGQMLVTTAVGVDQFGDIAKIRALRIVLARIAEAVGAAGAAPQVQAVTAGFVLSKQDPWVNVLRATIGCFAAAVGGAEIITTATFDSPIGEPDALGRRIARNTQIVLGEESNLHRVIDPAGGSWYVEDLTNRLASRAWSDFQDIEAAGGIVTALTDGTLRAATAETWQRQAIDAARRKRAITGVSEFADLDETPVVRAALPVVPLDTDASFPPRRLAESFESLRAAAAGPRAGGQDEHPRVFLANLGPVAAHAARLAWAQNFLAAGGIEAVSDEEGFGTPAAAATAFTASGCALAVLCSSDSVYQDQAVETAGALKAAGAQRVYMAGKPGDARARYEQGGIDEFVHVGCNVIESLRGAHELLGLERS